MKDMEHRKQLLIQQIADHRERMELELEVLRESNPVKPVVESGRRLLGIVGAIRGRGKTGSLAGPRAPIDAELVRTTLPMILMVTRALVHRHKERRARKESTR